MEMRELGEGIVKQELNLLFVIDNSGSMAGEKLGAVNNAIRDVMAIMPEIQEETGDVEIRISALTFSDVAHWVYPTPQKVSDFKWKDIAPEGGTNLSAAYDEMASYLRKRSNGGEMPDLGGVAPIILLMTDGLPTSSDWRDHLGDLQRKGWFRVALKYALAVGIDTQEAMDVLTEFTGNSETVLKVYTAEALRQVIRVIAVTASKVKSKSSSALLGTGNNASNNDLAQTEIAEKLEEVADVEW